MVAPYVDVTRMKDNYLMDLMDKTGLRAVTLAFALGGASGCEPMWGGEFDIENEEILATIKNFQRNGGKVIVATGGAMGPYLETSCTSPEQLALAYKKLFFITGTSHLDIDIGK